MKSKNTLLIVIAYLLMMTVWSTTPLAIKWSSQGVDFITGVSARMLIGAFFALLLTLITYKSMPMHHNARQVYSASALSIYGAMMMVYWGAQFIPSGLVSVLFGLTPIATAIFALYILDKHVLVFNQILGALIGLLGLTVIFFEQLNLGEQASLGIIATLLSVLLHSASALWIKRLNTPLPALIITSGGLLFSMPLFLITFMVFADPLPLELPLRTLASILYLGIVGSVIGFVSYYFVLAKLSASTVALATLITPITALFLGNWLNQESITLSIVVGTTLVLSGLVVHQFYGPIRKKFLNRI